MNFINTLAIKYDSFSTRVYDVTGIQYKLEARLRNYIIEYANTHSFQSKIFSLYNPRISSPGTPPI